MSAQTTKSKFLSLTVDNQRLLKGIIAQGENRHPESCLSGLDAFSQANSIISSEAQRRGLRLVARNNHVEIFRCEELQGVLSPIAPNLSMATRKFILHSSQVKQAFKLAGLPVPAGGVFNNLSSALSQFRSSLAPQLIKPLIRSGNRRHLVKIKNETKFVKEWQRATKKFKKAMVENIVEGDEIRLMLLEGEIISATCQLPAFVTGDGKSNIESLIFDKNQRRRQNPSMSAHPIANIDHHKQMSKRTLNNIPGCGEVVQLSKSSRINQGGETVSLLAVLHPSFFELAYLCHSAIPGATLLEIAVIAKNFGIDAFDNNAVVVGVNSDPDIISPCFVTYGKPSENVANKLLDFVEHQYSIRCSQKEREPAVKIVAAPVYRALCGGDSFPRSYRTQIRLLRQAAFAQGFQMNRVDSEMTVIADGKQRRLFYEGMSDGTLWVARQATNNKEWTKQLLKRAGVNVPDGRIFTSGDLEVAWTFACELGLPVVVKPLSGSGGKGISTNIRSHAHFRDAWQYAKATRRTSIIVERYYNGNDFRVFVIGNHLVAAAQRIPAHVIGDGACTIEELITLKNKLRMGNPHHGAKPMTITPAILHNLNEMGLSPTSIPRAGQKVSLHYVANIGGGGESVDVTDQIHPDWAEIAVKARVAVFDPPHIGLDLIAESMSLSPKAQSWAIVEINCNPDFGANHFPMQGPGRDVAGVLLENLFSEQPFSATHLTIKGQVQKVGYRRWLWRHAHLRGLQGWVCNLPDGSVEAVIGGTVPAVEDMLDRCQHGPSRARVDYILRKPWRGALPEGFEIKPEWGTGRTKSYKSPVARPVCLASCALEVPRSPAVLNG